MAIGSVCGLQVVRGRCNQSGAFLPRDAFRAAAIAWICPVANLDEDYIPAVFHDQVYLTPPATVIALEQYQAMLDKVRAGQLFRKLPCFSGLGRSDGGIAGPSMQMIAIFILHAAAAVLVCRRRSAPIAGRGVCGLPGQVTAGRWRR